MTDDLTPEGRLIEAARESLTPRASQNAAAKAAGMSGTRWRQIVEADASGMVSRRGVATLARMAGVVGLCAADFEAIGRHDVAGRLGTDSADEMLDDMERTLTRIEKSIAARADDRERPLVRAAIDALRAIVEKSTTQGPDR
jgi:hypothetical protein